MTVIMQGQYKPEARSRPWGAAERDGAVYNPVVRVNNIWPFQPGDTRQFADAQRIRQRRMVGTTGRVDTRQTHGSRLKPVDPRSEEHTSELQSRRDLVC